MSVGQKWAETHKNEIRDDKAGRDYTSHDLFRVYELVFIRTSKLYLRLGIGKEIEIATSKLTTMFLIFNQFEPQCS